MRELECANEDPNERFSLLYNLPLRSTWWCMFSHGYLFNAALSRMVEDRLR